MSVVDPNPSEASPPQSQGAYSIEIAAEITNTPRHLIAVYCRHGLVSTSGPPEDAGWLFDDEAIHELRRLEFLRSQYGLNLTALRAMAGLLRDVEHLRGELRFLRGR